MFPDKSIFKKGHLNRSKGTVFENIRKCLIKHCERSELIEMPIMADLSSFLEPKACIQRVFPDNSILIGHGKRSELSLHSEWKKVH